MSLVLPACKASVSRMVSRSRMLTRSRSRFCKTRCSSPARSRPGHDLADQGRRRGSDPLEKPLDLLAGQELVGMIGDDLAEVAGDDGGGFEDAAAGQLGDLAAVGVNPDRRLPGDADRRRRGRRAGSPARPAARPAAGPHRRSPAPPASPGS